MAERKNPTERTAPDDAEQQQRDAHGAAQQAVHAAAQAVEATSAARDSLNRADREKYEEALRQRQEADERTREAELRRIKLLTGDDDPDLLWVMSNRVDDRVVLFERDELHPGGEAFIGGSAPDHVYRTPAIAMLLNSGEIVEVPEPKDGPKKPLATAAAAVGYKPAAQPGQEVRLGRVPDPDLFDESAKRDIKKAQDEKPRSIPVPRAVVVPPPVGPVRESSRS